MSEADFPTMWNLLFHGFVWGVLSLIDRNEVIESGRQGRWIIEQSNQRT